MMPHRRETLIIYTVSMLLFFGLVFWMASIFFDAPYAYTENEEVDRE